MVAGEASAQDLNVALDQESLIWTGHYDGRITGQLDNYTQAAVKGFQRELGNSPTGHLTADEQSLLRQRGEARRAAVSFAVIDDARTGIQIGLPQGLTTVTQTTKWGVNWYAPDDKINIDTLRFVGSPNLSQLYDRLRGISGRVVRYSPLRDDWFVLEGEDSDGRQFYVRADARDNEVRAFSVTYDRGFKDRGFPIAMAMAASFRPFAAAVSPEPVAPPPQTTGRTTIAAGPEIPQEGDGDCFNGLGAACPTIARGR